MARNRCSSPAWPKISSEAFAWVSRSITRVRMPAAAKASARLTQVVVLPTPPLELAIEITRADMEFLSFGLVRSCLRVMADLVAQENTCADKICAGFDKISLTNQSIGK